MIAQLVNAPLILLIIKAANVSPSTSSPINNIGDCETQCNFCENYEDEFNQQKVNEVEQERWKPKEGELFFYIEIEISVVSDIWSGNEIDIALYNIGNCFRTEQEAQKKVDKIKQILNEK